LRQIRMGSPEDFLSYFVMGNGGSKAFSMQGKINTDDNLYLEFSAPRSIGMEYLRGTNLANLLQYREKLLPYLQPAESTTGRQEQTTRWEKNYRAALLEDKAHILDVSGQQLTYEFTELANELENRYPRYAPWRFTREASGDERGGTPGLLQELELPLLDEHEAPVKAEFMAVLVRKHSRQARVFFVDDKTRTVFGKLRIRGSGKDAYIERFVDGIFKEVRTIYAAEAVKAVADGKSAPSLLTLFPRIKTVVEARIDQE